MDIGKILAALRNERDLLEEAITALDRLSGPQKGAARQPASHIPEKIADTLRTTRNVTAGFD